MNSVQNPWDFLGKKTFNTHLKEGEIDPRAADNILIAWPSLLKVISQEFPKPKGIKILDFGCGTGGFCNKLESLGFDVTGIDPSVEMINIARQHSPPTIKYILGDQKRLLSLGTFNIITSIMTLPFIENIYETFGFISKVLKSHGLFISAVFNPRWVKACLSKDVSFADFNSNNNPQIGWKTFPNGIKISVYIRNSEEYDEIATKISLTKIIEDYPPFTFECKEFMKKARDYRPTNIPEYLILGYKKIV